MDKQTFTSHEELDAEYTSRLIDEPKNVIEILENQNVLQEWFNRKRELDRFGHTPIRQARIKNLSYG